MSGTPERQTTTAALLLTDVVDSTKLSEELGDQAMAELWARHDRVARDLLPLHHGREIDKTDGFLMLFEEASDAVRYVVAYHLALRDLGIAARAGLHLGEVILTENAPADVARGAKPLKVDGIAKPTAARVMSVATGGQTLLTAAAVEALGQTPLRLESHGHWRMKGVSEPIELFEVGDADAPFAPPPDGAKVYRVVERGELWLPVKEVEHSLPAERDAFVGRRRDLLALARRLGEEARLVSVLGIGGTGKTRLVIRYGWTWLGDYPGGVWFCDLSEARNLEDIATAVGRALDVPLAKGDPVEQLGHAIAGRGRCLVLLDNFEQVTRHAEDTVGRWLDRAGEAQFVVTTREVLGLAGEEALALAPLPASDGAALFVARARSAKRGFEPDNVDAINALVRLLDGLPLAIELAAARVRVMPPAKLLERMSQRFKLLTSGGGRRDRQATLRATLDWSWELLDADEQAALSQLSVFEGGFTLDAAEAVLALDEAWPMDAVQALVDKSLVRQVTEERFDLLVSVQEYAAEQLETSARSEAEERHGAWFATYGTDEAMGALDGSGGLALRRALALELDNVLAACRRAVVRGDGAVAARTLDPAWVVISTRGPGEVLVRLGESVLGIELAPPDRVQAELRFASALATLGRGDEARALLEAGLPGARELGSRRLEGALLHALGDHHLLRRQSEEANTQYNAALLIYREVGQRGLEGRVLGRLGQVSANLSRDDEARAYYEAALHIAREVGDRRHEANVVGNLGVYHWRLGRIEASRESYETALGIAREFGDRDSEGHHLGNLGSLQAMQGRLDGARVYYEDALKVTREVGNRRYEGHMLSNLGALHTVQGRPDQARQCLDAALVVVRQVRDRAKEGHVLGGLGLLLGWQGQFADAQILLDDALAITREIHDTHHEGKVLCDLGDLAQLQGQFEEAKARFDAALTTAREVGDRYFVGVVLGRVGDLHRVEGHPDQARASLVEAERLLRETADGSTALGELLCARAMHEHVDGARDDARATLAEAEAIAVSTGAGPWSELGRRLTQTGAAVAAAGGPAH